MLHPVYCDDVVVRGVRFVSADPEGQPFAEGEGPNGDGIDIDSSRNVRISDCFYLIMMIHLVSCGCLWRFPASLLRRDFREVEIVETCQGLGS